MHPLCVRFHALANLLLLVALPALAVDGVVEINQARALLGGITPGDTAGFPVTISESGSYRLTGNLDLSSLPSRDGISVTAPDVNIDLNGFTMTGRAVCSGDPPTEPITCDTFDSSNSGIDGGLSAAPNLTVRNGTIRGFPSRGVICTSGCRVIDVTVEGNGYEGINVAEHGLVRGCTARFNRLTGISANSSDAGAVIESSASIQNGGSGFFVSKAIVRASRAIMNSDTGIFTNPGSLVSGNIVQGNGENGIRLQGGAAFDNVIRDNGGAGIAVQNQHSSYARNTIDDNASSVTGGALAVETGVNLCWTNTTCP